MKLSGYPFAFWNKYFTLWLVEHSRTKKSHKRYGILRLSKYLQTVITHIHAYTYLCTLTCMRTYTHTCTHIHVCTCTCTHVCTRIHTHTHTGTHIHVHTCTNIHACIHTYIHEHTYTCTQTQAPTLHTHTCMHALTLTHASSLTQTRLAQVHDLPVMAERPLVTTLCTPPTLAQMARVLERGWELILECGRLWAPK